MRWKWLVAAIGILFTVPCSAQTVSKAGKITRIAIFDSGNFAFRIYLSNPAPECADGFLYVETSDPNYDGYTAGLLTAASTNKSVLVQSRLQNGFCRIVNYHIDF
jgi:hypothetical protein